MFHLMYRTVAYSLTGLHVASRGGLFSSLLRGELMAHTAAHYVRPLLHGFSQKPASTFLCFL